MLLLLLLFFVHWAMMALWETALWLVIVQDSLLLLAVSSLARSFCSAKPAVLAEKSQFSHPGPVWMPKDIQPSHTVCNFNGKKRGKKKKRPTFFPKQRVNCHRRRKAQRASGTSRDFQRDLPKDVFNHSNRWSHVNAGPINPKQLRPVCLTSVRGPRHLSGVVRQDACKKVSMTCTDS